MSGVLLGVQPEVLLALLLERVLLRIILVVLLSHVRGPVVEQVLGYIPDYMVQEEPEDQIL